MNYKRLILWGIPAILLVVFGTAELTGYFDRAEYGVYDAWLHVKPPVPQREEILFLDVDDLAIARVGIWPWSREIMARALITLREFDSGHTIFDIEYVDASPLSVDARVLHDEIPHEFEAEFGRVTGSMASLLEAVAAGQIPPGDAIEYLADLRDIAGQAQGRLLHSVERIVQDNDVLLGTAAAAHGNAWFTVNLIPDAADETPRRRIDFAIEHSALPRVTGPAPQVLDAKGLRPTIEPILQGGLGAGFPNVVIDQDGVRRRIELVRNYEGHTFGQLVFPPLLDLLGNPEVEIGRDRVILRGAVRPGEETPRDIRIPLAQDGAILINWPPGAYVDSFRHLSVYELVFYERLLEDLAFNLELMEASGYLGYHEGDQAFLEAWRYARDVYEDALTSGDGTHLGDLREIRGYFIEEAEAFLSGPAEAELLEQISFAAADPDLSPDMRQYVEELLEDIPPVFESSRALLADLRETEAILERSIPGSFIIIGYTGTGTTDIGVNPFEKEYANTGTHGALVNTILTGLFITDLPPWISLVVALIVTAIFILLSRPRSATTTLAMGFGGAAIVVGVSAGLLAGARIFLPIVAPTLTLVFSSVTQSAWKYIEVSRERSHIRNAFNHYLSTDVINQILDDPSRLRLGGEKRVLTAMFTDVKGFSTISESLDPEELVHLLNEYLSEMSNVVLSLRGTIDKFEGDAIISFFGAPIPYDDHPQRACTAAVRMKKIETDLNRRFLETGLSPTPLATRVGLNTGEMVVGNMGTAERMDYTIMGHAVNLAARLEGVNKQYGTWILASELTIDATGGTLVTRRMDRVRVVGISEPIRLHEILDEKAEATDSTYQLVEEFHQGLEHFENRQWGEAQSTFSRILEDYPEDGPSRTFLDRSTRFTREPPAKNWDGVFSLAQK